MRKLLRVLLSIFAVLSLSAALAACGDDDDGAETDETTTTEAEGGGEGEEGNPCADGASFSEEGAGGPEPAEDATPVEIGVTETDGDAGRTYGFTGAEAMATQGEYAMTLNNTGEEMHMVSITRLADSETRSVEEILALPESEQESIDSTEVAEAFACPGQTASPVEVSIDEPGRYVLLCFIPVGSTADADPLPEGPSHAAQGMYEEVTVA